MQYRIVMTIVFLTSIALMFSCGSKEDQDTMHSDEMSKDVESSIVRDYNVDVASLDENGDGNVFQCPMDWEVISDEQGNCPLCNMVLKEYTIEDAQKNLEEHRPHNH
jgi:hypothetical protein